MIKGLRVKAIVKEPYREAIALINSEDAYFDEYVDLMPFVTDFIKLQRASLIPTGSSAYMPAGWLINDEIATDGFGNIFDMKTGYWAFQCCLKNSENVVNVFLQDVLSQLIESAIHIEVKHEEDDEGELYRFINGHISKWKLN